MDYEDIRSTLANRTGGPLALVEVSSPHAPLDRPLDNDVHSRVVMMLHHMYRMRVRKDSLSMESADIMGSIDIDILILPMASPVMTYGIPIGERQVAETFPTFEEVKPKCCDQHFEPLVKDWEDDRISVVTEGALAVMRSAPRDVKVPLAVMVPCSHNAIFDEYGRVIAYRSLTLCNVR